MIGTHAVTVYADRAAQAPVALGANFDLAADQAGWAPGPFEANVWTWAGGATSSPLPNSLNRTNAAVVARPVAGRVWRLRVTFRVDAPCTAWGYVQFGTTQQAAATGPFWSPGLAVDMWDARNVEPGTYALEWTFRPSVQPDAKYVWIAPRFSFTDFRDKPGTVVVDYAALHYQSATTSEDMSCLVDQISIQHGRSEPTGQPEASSATLDLTTGPGAPLPTALDVGAILVITTSLPGAQSASTRFSGRVTDMSLGWDDAGPGTPDAGTGQVVAVGMLADLGRRVVGDVPWPAELDGTRVARVLDLAGFPTDPNTSDPGTVQILARDVDSKAALEVAGGVAESAGGLVWQTRAGDIRYADADHRRGTGVGLDLDACDVLVTPVWQRNVGGLVNQVSIGYGDTPEGEDQPRFTGVDQASIDKFGRYAYSFTSELSAAADATAMGLLLLTRNNSPAWNMAALPVDIAELSADETAQLLGLDMHSLVRLTGLPAIGTAPTNVVLWVEGWVERLAWGEHEIALNVSGFCRTAPPPRWNDLNPATTWNTVDAALTWNGATCLGPATDTGLWDNVPASKRWDDLAATTWDQWTTTPLEIGV